MDLGRLIITTMEHILFGFYHTLFSAHSRIHPLEETINFPPRFVRCRFLFALVLSLARMRLCWWLLNLPLHKRKWCLKAREVNKKKNGRLLSTSFPKATEYFFLYHIRAYTNRRFDLMTLVGSPQYSQQFLRQFFFSPSTIKKKRKIF